MDATRTLLQLLWGEGTTWTLSNPETRLLHLLPSDFIPTRLSVQVTYFPFDWQNCTMQFRSYTYDSTEIEIQYTLDSRGNEIREVQMDESYSGENQQRPQSIT